ncbi:hypothetical protein FACS1894102_7240 [Spirochaetia bacterium]|nr:hypothetical protein FACS1894102_7240 [Spirochaetia bacterium]
MYYHNTVAAAGIIISTGSEIVLQVRAKDPSKGLLGVPGGFIEPGEGIVEGLRRECIEELDWDPGANCTFFASFPNVYPYKNILYNVCDMFFTVTVPNLKPQDFKLDKNESSAVKFIRPQDIKPQELAFDSTRKVIEAYKNLV